jgi:hypothetical protein
LQPSCNPLYQSLDWSTGLPTSLIPHPMS